MEYKKAELQKEVEKLEAEMGAADFWSDKNKAQRIIRRIAELKAEIVSGGTSGKYDAGDAVMTIFSGAGGDDAEDFSTMLLNMYIKFCAKKSFGVTVLHQNENDHGGYRNVTIEISGKSAYGTLKNESGVHRLVRVSPFNANAKRHTSFSMVEVIPKFEKINAKDIDIPESERKKRAWLRSALKNLNFKMIQQSVWIGKVRIPEEFLRDLRNMHLTEYVEIFEISKAGSLQQITKQK